MKTHYFKSWKIQSNIIVRFAENGRFLIAFRYNSGNERGRVMHKILLVEDDEVIRQQVKKKC